MEITKSSRHQIIIGDFGEHLICNFLSRSGFEISIINHTGIDIIAYNEMANIRIGITVKSRTRVLHTEDDSVNIFSYHNGKDDRQKVLYACKAFACEPWIAIYVEKSLCADIYLTSLEHYDSFYRGTKKRAIDDWKMCGSILDKYNQDGFIKHIHFDFNFTNWRWDLSHGLTTG